MKKDKFSRNGYRPFMPERDRHVRPSVQEGKEEGERERGVPSARWPMNEADRPAHASL